MSWIRRRWPLLLAISAALNLFLLGAVTVHLSHHAGFREGAHPRGPAPSAEGPHLWREMVHVLGGPHDPRVQRLWGERRGELRQVRKDARAAREALSDALTREPFDEKALEAALDQMHALTSQTQLRAQSALLSLARELTPEERRHLAEAARRRGPRGPHGHGR